LHELQEAWRSKRELIRKVESKNLNADDRGTDPSNKASRYPLVPLNTNKRRLVGVVFRV
jgi:hypothetical protein